MCICLFVYYYYRLGKKMGLKDLVAQKAALTEEAIEAIIADYMRFDTDEMEIAFTPEFASLSNKAKVLVYLVGLQGWPFVADEAISTVAKPAVIEETLGIPGGTLRPILKDLKDSHLITVKKGEYSVRSSHLESVKAAIIGAPSRTSAIKKTTKKKTAKKKAKPKSNDAVGKKKNSGIAETINEWIADGFFDKGKTTGDVRDRFHEETIIIPVSSIPGYVNKAVKEKILTRKKEEVNGKLVWVYRTKKSGQ